jgi:hypothetical protein
MALSSMGTVFFTAFATLTGTARSGAFAAVFELQETLARDATSSKTRAADDFLSLFDGVFFMISLASPYLWPTAHIGSSAHSLEFQAYIS